MMAAAVAAGGAPEVIAQLENAAKVLMVRRPAGAAAPFSLPFFSVPVLPPPDRPSSPPSARGSARGALPAAWSRAGAGRAAPLPELSRRRRERGTWGSGMLLGRARRCAAGAGHRAAAG